MGVEALQAQADALIRRGQWPQLAHLAERLQAADARDPLGHYLGGYAALRSNRLRHAVASLETAVALAPPRPDYLVELARAYVTVGMEPEAVDAANRAMALSPQDALQLDTLGIIYGRTHFHRLALDAFERAAKAAPGNGSIRFNLGSEYSFVGDIDAAERELQACIAVEPAEWRAYLALSHLRRQVPGRNHIRQWEGVLRRASGARPELYLHLAIAKEYEDLGDHGAAFEHMSAGKRAGGRGRGYHAAMDAHLFDAIRKCFPGSIAAAAGYESDEPIFVVGMPRTGTTLVDRILSSHPQVHSAGELRNFLVALHRLAANGPGFVQDPTLPARMASIDWKGIGEAYVSSTRPGTGHSTHFVDKMPHNFLFAGFIALALPRARILCLRRNPMDTCLSNFRQVFSQESRYFDYSYDLMDTARYFMLFDRLVAHWKRVFPGRILEVEYEALVESQEDSTRGILDFCGLPWEDACLRFEDNVAAVSTASAVQVRSGMNRDSLQRWKRYGDRLDPLRRLLEDGGIEIRD